MKNKIILLTLCLALLIAQIDTAVVNLALQPIAEDLKIQITTLQWIIDSYNMMYAILLLTGGLLADLYGRRRIFIAGVAIFTVATLLCALAPSAWLLITGRALSGVGAALLVPASLAIIRVVWQDAKERAQALGIWASCNGLAMVIGPTLGGLLIKPFGWRSIFFVVVPIGLIAFVLSLRSMPESRDTTVRDFDASAQFFGAIALAGVVFSGIQIREEPMLAGIALVTSIISGILFLRIESKKGSTALVPLDIFKSSSFCGAMIATSGMTFGMYGLLFLLPMFWQSSGKFSPFQSAIALLPMALAFIIVSPRSGTLTERFSTRLISTGGVTVIMLGLLILGINAPLDSILLTEISLALTGIGMGLATGPLLGTAISSVKAERSGTASAIVNVARMIGATLGVALLGTAFSLSDNNVYGLQIAMFLGAFIQLVCCLVSWRTITH